MLEPLDAFLTDFGQAATLGGTAITGLFDDAYADALGVAGTGPSLLVKTSVCGSVTPGSTSCVTNGVTYTVTRLEPDGTGMTRLALQE